MRAGAPAQRARGKVAVCAPRQLLLCQQTHRPARRRVGSTRTNSPPGPAPPTPPRGKRSTRTSFRPVRALSEGRQPERGCRRVPPVFSARALPRPGSPRVQRIHRLGQMSLSVWPSPRQAAPRQRARRARVVQFRVQAGCRPKGHHPRAHPRSRLLLWRSPQRRPKNPYSVIS